VTTENAPPTDFIRQIVKEDVASNKFGRPVCTRFPPEPNGYLHIGHAKAITIDFSIAKENGGVCHLRMDDTNPEAESMEYAENIMRDIRWLGFDWGDKLFFASDYYPKLYEYAVKLIEMGKAYVDSQPEEEIRKQRGGDRKEGVIQPGTNSPYRDRPIEESLDLFTRMKNGEFEEGEHVLRAKIDMADPNMKMRDPIMYRVKRAHHYRTGDQWVIYPLYDFAHCLSDAIEGITHSLCSLEFENNRALYDWFLRELGFERPPQQIEFARLNLSHTIMSKRNLLKLVQNGLVSGWDDPRMPTLSGMRRRGYTPEAIRDFVNRVGVARRENLVDIAQLEHSVREDLNVRVPRAMAVLRPLTLIIDNYPEGQEEEFEAANYPDDPEKMGFRKVPFSRVLYIEQDDFMENPPKKFFRLAPGNEVRLRWAYLVRCTSVVKDAGGKIVEVHCTYDPDSRGGTPKDGRKVKGTIHWVSAKHAVAAEVRLYETLLSVGDASAEERSFLELLNPHSLEVIANAKLERSLGKAKPGDRFQFERTGYFAVDPDSTDSQKVFNRTVSLKDSWAKEMKKS
jgi:glutaminyl-tRNA synthetase